jgi:hypothetical protein
VALVPPFVTTIEPRAVLPEEPGGTRKRHVAQPLEVAPWPFASRAPTRTVHVAVPPASAAFVSVRRTGRLIVSVLPATARDGARRSPPNTSVAAGRDASSYVHGTMLSGARSSPSTPSTAILTEMTVKLNGPVIPASSARKPISSRPG